VEAKTAAEQAAPDAAAEPSEANDTPSRAGAAAGEPAEDRAEGSEKTPRPNGPFDVSEVDLSDPQVRRVDLGGLLVRGGAGMKLQLQVDERTGAASSVIVVAEDAAVQLIAVAAPRSSGMWEQARAEIAADAQRRGGTVSEAPGPFGTEVRLVLPVTTPEGKSGVRPSRVAGIDGPRWMLRATFLGKATTDAQAFARLVRVVRDTVVVRGDRPMAPGDVIPLKAPAAPEPAAAGPDGSAAAAADGTSPTGPPTEPTTS
jgi:hypothetical protein